MRRAVLPAALCALVLGGTVTSPAADASPTPPARVDGRVLILHTDTGADARSGALHAAVARLGGTVRHVFGSQQAVSVDLPATTSAADVAELPGVARLEAPVRRTLAGLPDDPKLPVQRRYLDAVRAPEAWNVQHGSGDVRVAVIDTGLDVGHPDLAGKIVGTYNALTGTASVPDSVGHGTFVAGVVAADTDNGVGVAGAGFDTDVLGVKVVDRYGDIAIDDEVAGIRWAVDHGADVVNLSLSGPDPSTAEQQAVRYAQSKGVLVVAAAGNDGTDAEQYPAAYPGVVAVGATDPARHRRATFSSYGPWVTLAAPGVDIASTTPRAGSDYFATRSGYARGEGTSFAAPLVSAAAALVKAQNPALTGPALRAALVASASGYAGSGLGRGQLDFARALNHVAPVLVPTLALASGTAGEIRFTARSGAPRVGFRVDGGPVLATAAAGGDQATYDFPSYGYANGVHTLTAVACSAYDECATGGLATPFVIANRTPDLLTPTADDTVSGGFTATADNPGGGVRLLVDGRAAAFAADAPYELRVNATRWADGPHRLQVQTCTGTQDRCDGPTSAATEVDFDSLHPVITGLSRSRISPDGNRSGDTAVLSFALPEAQAVAVETLDTGGRVLRRDPLGTLPAGAHTWTWRGLGRDDVRLPDGRYDLALVTSRTVDGTTRRGQTVRAGTVDTVAPRLASLRGAGVRVFPVRDGYRDTFTPSTALPDGGRLTLTVRTTSGHTVRAVTVNARPSARATVTWDGRTAAGRVAAAGTYRWTFTVTDRAGNVRRSAARTVVVSAAALHREAATVARAGATSRDLGGTASCAARARSAYAHGVRLVNRCRDGSGEIAFARYAFRVPAAHRYERLSLAVLGRSVRASELSVSFDRADGGLEVPPSVRIGPGTARRHPIGGVAADGHVTRGTVHITLVLSSRYAGANDIDLRDVALRVTYLSLR